MITSWNKIGINIADLFLFLAFDPEGAVAEWVRALAWAGDRTVSRPGSNPATVTSLRNFGNSVYPALPVSFGGDTKSRRSLLSGVYARGSKRSHQSALECVTVVDSTTHSKKLPDLQSAIMRRKTLPCTCIGRRRRRWNCRNATSVDNCYKQRNLHRSPWSVEIVRS